MKHLVARKSPLRPLIVVSVALVFLLMTFAAACGSDSTATTDDTSVSGSDTTGNQAGGETQTLLVATASSLKEAFTEIAQAFDQTHASETTLTFDSSGALQKQIEAGAPADVFASAAMLQVDNLLQKGLVDESSITTFASNELVLAAPADSKLGISSFEDLAKPEVEKITTGDPTNAPHGKAAVEILTTLGLIDQVQPKLIYAKNASQTLTYVVQGEVDAGIMFATDATLGGDKVKVVATSEPGWHSELAYVLAIVTASENKTLAQEFVDFVTGSDARPILEKYGYMLPAAP